MVLVENDIEHPIKLIFDPPMRTDGGQRLGGGHLARQQIEPAADGDFAVRLFQRGHKTGKALDALEMSSARQARRHRSSNGYDSSRAAVIGVDGFGRVIG
jgi:hypothetical protein